jgi:hypothetical protein
MRDRAPRMRLCPTACQTRPDRPMPKPRLGGIIIRVSGVRVPPPASGKACKSPSRSIADRAYWEMGAEVAVYTARHDGSGVRGPYVARSELLTVRPQFQSETTAKGPTSAKSVYVADVPFARTGKQAVIAIAKLDGRLLVTNGYSVNVTRPSASQPPGVGDRAISVHTQTLTDVGGNAAALDTRRPVAKDLLRDDLADVLGKRPVVITFATPLLCQSRVCGPTVDIVEQVRGGRREGRRLHPPGDLQRQPGQQGRPFPGIGVQAPQRAVDLCHRQARRDHGSRAASRWASCSASTTTAAARSARSHAQR